MKSSVGKIAPWPQTNWDWRAAGNFIGGGSGAGLLLLVPFVGAPTRPLVTVIGLALICAGLLCVWLEIGQPWRALNVFLQPESSWMTREAILAPLLLAFGAALVWAGRGEFAAVVAGLALGYAYCQARMLQGARGIPAWRHPRGVPLLMSSALAEGCAVALVVLSIPERADLPTFLPWLAAAAWCLRALSLTYYRHGLHSAAPIGTLEVLDRQIGVDRALTLLALAALAAAATLPGARWLVGLAGLAAVAAAWLFKFTLIVRAAFTQGFALPRLPVRGPGHAVAGVKPGW